MGDCVPIHKKTVLTTRGVRSFFFSLVKISIRRPTASEFFNIIFFGTSQSPFVPRALKLPNHYHLQFKQLIIQKKYYQQEWRMEVRAAPDCCSWQRRYCTGFGEREYDVNIGDANG
jgi:hypothetical protein